MGLSVLLVGQFVWRAEVSLRQESPVWDETMHLDYGLNFLRLGPLVPPRDHPYPVVALFAVPWVVTTPDAAQVLARPRLKNGHEVELRRIEDSRNLFPARRMNLALGALTLVLVAAWAGRRLGPEIGLATLAVGAFDPGWMASARYATTDIAHGAAFVAAIAAALAFRRDGRTVWAILAGIAVGFGTLAKFSGLLGIPALVLIALWPEGRTLRARLWSSVRGGALAGVGAAAVLALVFEGAALVGPGEFGNGYGHLLEGVSEFARIRALPSGSWLLGHYFEGGTVWFFPVLLLVKTPIAQLAAILSGVLGGGLARIKNLGPAWIGPALYLAVAIVSSVNLGHRHLTPVLPFVWIGAAVGVVTLVHGATRGAKPLAVALALGVVAENALCHPHYLAFANGLAGGVDGMSGVAVDASCDWGQDLPALRAWISAHAPDEPVHLAYFGTADPSAFGINAIWRRCGPLGLPRPRGAVGFGCGEPAPWLAISATCLQGAAGGSSQDTCWERLRAQEPEAVLGGSIYLYRNVPPGP